ncbi:MAG TPA: carboxypeptidase-like regulatory domain-containing protein, partial [Tenuifilaceae bacterium]|nr:carboxypeptidase-like regulatory domain-containing protein [Tenuifilaceae bacterium]
MENRVKGFFIVLLFVLVSVFNAYTQESIKGTVVERNSKLPISFATVVYQKNSLQKGVITDVHGKFEIVESGISSITVSCMGYKSKQVVLASISNKLNLVIELEEAAYEIKGVVVTPKDNPALRIIRNA